MNCKNDFYFLFLPNTVEVVNAIHEWVGASNCVWIDPQLNYNDNRLLFVGNRVIGYELSQQLLIPPSSPGSHQDKFDLKPNNRHSKAMVPFSIS